MSNSVTITILSLLILILTSCSTTPSKSTNKKDPLIIKGVKPTSKTISTVALDKKFFKISYDKKHRLARSVKYTLKVENLKKPKVKRSHRFFADIELLKLKLVPVGPEDYKNSGYDRGHLAPSGDFLWSREANKATFVMSNMVPQKPRLNRVAWRAIENKVRSWACTEKELIVITGPILNTNLPVTSTGVKIPKKFYKVIYDNTPPHKAIGFIFDQSDNDSKAYQKNVKTIRQIEEVSGIDFFSELSKANQDKVETSANLNLWKSTDCK